MRIVMRNFLEDTAMINENGTVEGGRPRSYSQDAVAHSGGLNGDADLADRDMTLDNF